MSPAPEAEPREIRPLRLLAVVVLTSALFLVGLAVAAFLSRDMTFDGRRAASSSADAASDAAGPAGAESTLALDAGAAPQKVPSEAIHAAVAALGPVARRCLEESRRQDPGIGDRLELEVGLSLSGGEGALGSPSVPPGYSPFLRGCLLRAVPQVRFAHEGRGEARLVVHITPEGASLAAPVDAARATDGGLPP